MSDDGDWLSLVKKGKALLVDAAEEVNALHEAVYSHGILGVPASLIPFSKHNQAPRLQFSSSMMKQAIVSDGNKYRLNFCQEPLVQSKSTRFLPPGIANTGMNVQVAVMIDSSGFAQEDALIYNKGSLDRGLFSMTMHQIIEEAVHVPKVGDIIRPDPTSVAPMRGRVVRVDSQRVHTLTYFVPRVGDKFTSRHGQKGVIAHTEAPENLPFSECDGMVPDLIINPHAFPSRMTEGQHIEGAIGVAAATHGFCFEEGSIESNPRSVIEYLLASGFVDGGKRILRCGRTGRSFETKVLIAPVYYNRLTHLVENKARVRGHGGSMDPLTQQPAKGRKNGGGIRLGEMEVHAILAQGANDVLKDRLSNAASFVATIDKDSGSLLYDTIPAREFSRNNTDHGPRVKEVRMPYGTKLLMQEMQALGIRMVVNT